MRLYKCLPVSQLCSGPYSIIPIQDEYIENIRLWRNLQMDVLRQMSAITSTQQKAYFEEKIWPDMLYDQPANILMAYLKNRELIGYGGLVHIAWEHSRAEVSFLSNPSRANDGNIYTVDQINFLSLMKRLAFEQLGFNRLFTETYHSRQLHIENLETAGFIREGIMCAHVLIDGHAIDSVIHGCLRSYEK